MAAPAPEETGLRADRAAASLLLAFGVFVGAQARQLAYWTGNAPGPGYLPFWLGVLLSCAAAVLLLKTLLGPRRSTPGPFPGRPLAVRLATVVGLTVAAAVLMTVAGLVLASAAFVAATLFYLRPGRAAATWTTAAATAFVLWLVFGRWLGVALPRGPFGF